MSMDLRGGAPRRPDGVQVATLEKSETRVIGRRSAARAQFRFIVSDALVRGGTHDGVCVEVVNEQGTRLLGVSLPHREGHLVRAEAGRVSLLVWVAKHGDKRAVVAQASVPGQPTLIEGFLHRDGWVLVDLEPGQRTPPYCR